MVGACLYRQADRHRLSRGVVAAHVVGQAVVEHAHSDVIRDLKGSVVDLRSSKSPTSKPDYLVGILDSAQCCGGRGVGGVRSTTRRNQ